MVSKQNRIKVLELFSGIGGMHFSLSLAKKVLYQIGSENNCCQEFDFEVVKVMDISEVANKGK